MSRVPVVSAERLLTILLRAGFFMVRQKGSHIRLEHPATRKATTIPLHASDLTRKLQMKILKQAGISGENFRKLM